MIKNYLKIALRSLLKQKIYAFINVIGLATGIASCALILMFVADELSYDSFHRNADRIYKVALERIYPNHSTRYAVVPHSFGDVMQDDFPEVATVVKMAGPFDNTGVSYRDASGEEKIFEEDRVMAADSNFFEVFGIKVIEGDPATALADVSNVVLTAQTARRYFGDENPVGKTLRILNLDRDYTVSAVCENVPENSHLQFDFLLRAANDFFADGRPNFIAFNSHIYILLDPGADPAALESKFPAMVDRYASAQIETNLKKSWKDYKKEGNGYRYFLQPLRDIHLDPANLEAKIKPGGNTTYVYLLMSISLLILIIACINFMNLATARSAERGREVGVRKTMGSLKGQLIKQFLVESMLVSSLATLISLAMIYSILPYFNELTGKSLEFTMDLRMTGGLIGVTLIVGMLAGSYPAFVLSSFNPVAVIKGDFRAGRHGSGLRNGLVVFQFTISIVLISSTLVVRDQMQFMQNKSLGYNKEHILIVERVFALQNPAGGTFIEELKRLPEVVSAAGSFSMLGGGRTGDFFGEQWTLQGSSEIHTTKSMVIDDGFAAMIGFELADGRSFGKDINDSLAVMLNETAVKTFGLADPIGKKLAQHVITPDGPVVVSYTIAGVVKDFNFQSLHDPVTPLTIRSNESFNGGAAYAYARVTGKDLPSAIQRIQNIWKEMAPGQPFRYSFLDENLNALYEEERRAGRIFSVFSALAILIACVGLFGLAAYTGQQRTKEIGIRKILGASMTSVVVLLSGAFTRLILIAFVLAVPLAWYLMEKWLTGFAYRIELGPALFVFSGVIAVVISWITVSYQSIRAAVMDPVKSLRSE